MNSSELHVKVVSDFSEVKNDIEELKVQIEQLRDTVERLNDNGINVSLKVNVDGNKMKKFLNTIFNR